jgi:hypothetical protein
MIHGIEPILGGDVHNRCVLPHAGREADRLAAASYHDVRKWTKCL